MILQNVASVLLHGIYQIVNCLLLLVIVNDLLLYLLVWASVLLLIPSYGFISLSWQVELFIEAYAFV